MTATIALGPMKSGRPRAKANENKPRFWESELYAVLYKTLPQFVVVDDWGKGRLDLKKIASAVDKHHFTVNKWLTNNKLSPDGASALIKESNGKLTAQDLANFLIS